jgi:hypothetical protein
MVVAAMNEMKILKTKSRSIVVDLED